MHMQILSFDGPRSPEQNAAAQRAGRERIAPLIDADPELRARLLGGYHCVGADGAFVYVAIAADEATFDIMRDLVMTSELLPGEDPALLTGPSRVQRFVVTEAFGALGAFGVAAAATDRAGAQS